MVAFRLNICTAPLNMKYDLLPSVLSSLPSYLTCPSYLQHRPYIEVLDSVHSASTLLFHDDSF